MKKDRPRRTKGNQDVLPLIAPLGKLGRYEEASDFFFQVDELQLPYRVELRQEPIPPVKL